MAIEHAYDYAALIVPTALYGGAGNDDLSGNNGNDYIEGNEDNDNLNGGLGNDNLLGGQGDDNLTGGKDNDTLIGGIGFDTYIYKTDDGFDTQADFSFYHQLPKVHRSHHIRKRGGSFQL